VGWGTDRPRFVFPDGSRLPTRLTAVLRHQDGDWKVVQLHFFVGVPAIEQWSMGGTEANRTADLLAERACKGRRSA
jgi:hypothetical protein